MKSILARMTASLQYRWYAPLLALLIGGAISHALATAPVPRQQGIAAGPVAAQAEVIQHTPRFRALASELRCLVCQNQTLLDSHADLANDLRMEVVRLMLDGQDDAEIKHYLVERYGEFVLYRPVWSWRNGLLWGGPLLMLLLAALAIWQLSHRRTRLPDTAPPHAAPNDAAGPPQAQCLCPEDALRHVDALLATLPPETTGQTMNTGTAREGSAGTPPENR